MRGPTLQSLDEILFAFGEIHTLVTYDDVVIAIGVEFTKS